MSALYSELLLLALSDITPGTYVSPCGMDMLYIGLNADPQGVEHINMQGHIFLLD